MAEDLYEPPGVKISQGDILEKLPTAYLVPPLQALFARADGLMGVEAEEHPDFNDRHGQSIVATCKRAKALLLTRDCEIDKPKVKHWVVAPIVPLSLIPGSSHGDAKKNKIFSLLYLPSYRDVLEESVLVLNYPTTLSKDFVESAKRILSFSDLGRKALYAQHIRWLSRWQFSEIRCPHCAVSFNASEGMTVRED